MKLEAPIVDTSVLVDMAIASRPRHGAAEELTLLFEREEIKPWVPANGVFEFHAAIAAENDPHDETRFPSDEHPIDWHVVYIDEVFLTHYFSPHLRHARGCDLIFIALALGEGRTLISEDEEQRRAAKWAGVQALTIREYLDLHPPD